MVKNPKFPLRKFPSTCLHGPVVSTGSVMALSGPEILRMNSPRPLA